MPINFEIYEGRLIWLLCPKLAVRSQQAQVGIIGALTKQGITQNSFFVTSSQDQDIVAYGKTIAQAFGAEAYTNRSIDRAGLNPILTRSVGEVALFAVSGITSTKKPRSVTEEEVLSEGLVVCIQSPLIMAFSKEKLVKEPVRPGLYPAVISFTPHPGFDEKAVKKNGGCALSFNH